jgi:hypothetical protein
MEELEYIDEYNEITIRATGELSGVIATRPGHDAKPPT